MTHADITVDDVLLALDGAFRHRQWEGGNVPNSIHIRVAALQATCAVSQSKSIAYHAIAYQAMS